MLLLLIHFLHAQWGWQIPTVFEYVSTRMALAAITSLLIVVFTGKRFIRKLYEWKIGDRVRDEECPLLGELHRSKNDTPTMGGILIIFSLLVSLLLWMNLSSTFSFILLLTTVCIGALGAYDDFLKLKQKSTKGLSAKKKFLFQFLFSGIIVLYLLWPQLTQSLQKGVFLTPPNAKEEQVDRSSLSKMALLTTKQYASRLYLPFKKHPLLTFRGGGMLLLGVFMVCVIVGTSNAVNLTDGLDGLATGTVMLAASAFAFIAFLSNHFDLSRYLNILYIEGSSEIAIYLSAIVGACLGFLWYNAHPAQVFMGDTGSLTLGALLGVSAVLLKRELLLVIIGGVFVVEALSVILQVMSYRLRNKKRVFLCAPLHHHFEYKGWPESKIVLRFWIVSLLLAIVGVASLKFQ